MMLRLLVATVALLPAPILPRSSLTLDDVLRSPAVRSPQIVEAMARERQAQGRALTAEGELADSMAMAMAKRRRFQLGASDFFLLNLREEAATDARVRLLDAQARAALAAADLAGATGDRARLGLEGLEAR